MGKYFCSDLFWHPFSIVASANLDLTGFIKRINGISQSIHQHLIELTRRAFHHGQVAISTVLSMLLFS